MKQTTTAGDDEVKKTSSSLFVQVKGMAGITSAFPFKPLPSSKPFGISLLNPNSSNLNFLISARYGGGGGRGFSRSPPGNHRQNNSNVDQALDFSAIRSQTVRLIDQTQNMVGIMPKSEALQMAEDAQLDLVILSLNADPPVVRLMDYNKHKYELQKKKRDQQKKNAAHRMDLKELKMGYNIDVHDYSVRLKAARKFFKDGDKVKVVVNLKGRGKQFKSNAIELIKRFQHDIGELATEESKNFRDKNITLVLVPNKAILQKGEELLKKKDKSTVTEVSASVLSAPIQTS